MSWLRQHSDKVPAILDKVRSTGTPKASEFPERVYTALGTDNGGSDWTWIYEFMRVAHEAGMDDSVHPLSDEDREAAEAQARAWLTEHSSILGGMIPYQNENAGPSPEDAFRASKQGAISMGALWLILPTLYAVFLGMASFTRPFDTTRLPGWILSGLALLLRQKDGKPEPRALLRVVAGGITILAGLVLILLMRATGIPGARVVMALSISAGGALLLSGLNFNEEAQ